MRIEFMDRAKFRMMQPDKETLAISIVDPDFPFPVTGYRAAVQISCLDVEHNLPMDYRFTPSHAQAILEFMDTWSPNAKRVFVHCEQGLSRSPAVAMALSRIYGLEPTEVVIMRMRPLYNRLIYRLILEAHMLRKDPLCGPTSKVP